jgi:hypothetical protein
MKGSLENKGLRSFMIVVGIAVFFFLWGMLVFLAVGDKGPPPWDFGAVPDVPGESPYSSRQPRKEELSPQHVMDGGYRFDVVGDKSSPISETRPGESK